MPPTDQRFLAATQEEICTDYWAHYYFDHPKEAALEVDDPDFDIEELKQRAESGEWEEI